MESKKIRYEVEIEGKYKYWIADNKIELNKLLEETIKSIIEGKIEYEKNKIKVKEKEENKSEYSEFLKERIRKIRSENKIKKTKIYTEDEEDEKEEWEVVKNALIGYIYSDYEDTEKESPEYTEYIQIFEKIGAITLPTQNEESYDKVMSYIVEKIRF